MKRTARTLTTLTLAIGCCGPLAAADLAAALPGNASYVLETGVAPPSTTGCSAPWRTA